MIKKEEFIENIKYLYETDVGDFKRKVGLYLNRFIEAKSHQGEKKWLHSLKNEILYKDLKYEDQMKNIELLRALLIDKLEKMYF
ncbi:MAG: hypothetical protein GDA46_03440 [Bdellovibrionales bacterium]|nr:hypothetical protein [Bdellovibrionales bacterium]